MLLLDLIERGLLRTHVTAKDPMFSRTGLSNKGKKPSYMVKEGWQLDFFRRDLTNRREKNETWTQSGQGIKDGSLLDRHFGEENWMEEVIRWYAGMDLIRGFICHCDKFRKSCILHWVILVWTTQNMWSRCGVLIITRFIWEHAGFILVYRIYVGIWDMYWDARFTLL